MRKSTNNNPKDKSWERVPPENGVHTGWYENGQKCSETIFKNGYGVSSKHWNRDGSLKDGVHTFYFEDNKNKMIEYSYKDGKPHGTHTHWYDENGQKYSEKNYKDGKPHGTHSEWYKNGQKWSEETYLDGKPSGTHVSWFENGQKKSEEIYKDGNKISSKEWNEDGSVRKKPFYLDSIY